MLFVNGFLIGVLGCNIVTLIGVIYGCKKDMEEVEGKKITWKEFIKELKRVWLAIKAEERANKEQNRAQRRQKKK